MHVEAHKGLEGLVKLIREFPKSHDLPGNIELGLDVAADQLENLHRPQKIADMKVSMQEWAERLSGCFEGLPVHPYVDGDGNGACYIDCGTATRAYQLAVFLDWAGMAARPAALSKSKGETRLEKVISDFVTTKQDESCRCLAMYPSDFAEDWENQLVKVHTQPRTAYQYSFFGDAMKIINKIKGAALPKPVEPEHV